MPERSQRKLPADRRGGSLPVSSRLFRGQHACEPFAQQRLQERCYVARECCCVHVMPARKATENFADLAWFRQHVPYVACDPVKVEIRAGGETQDNGATIDIGHS